MDERRNRITSKQLLVFIASTQIGIGLLSLSSRLARVAGHDGWISTLLAGIVAILISVIAVLLLKRYGDKSIFDINTYIYGKYIGMFFNFFIILYMFLKGTLSVRIFTEVIKAIVLKLTPPVILTFFLLIPTIYLIYYGLKPICRFANILFIIIPAVLFYLAVIFRFERLTFLMPVGEAGIGPIISGIPLTAYSYLGFMVVTIIYPNITDKENTMKYAIGATAVTTILFTLVVAAITGFFGEVMTVKLTFPLFSLTRSYKAPIFERIDLYFLIFWFPAMAMSLRTYLFLSYYSTCKIFRFKKTAIVLTALVVSSVFLGRIIKDLSQVLALMNSFDYIGIPTVLFFSIGNYLLSFINKKGVVKK